jgi:hypothetical protein
VLRQCTAAVVVFATQGRIIGDVTPRAAARAIARGAALKRHYTSGSE